MKLCRFWSLWQLHVFLCEAIENDVAQFILNRIVLLLTFIEIICICKNVADFMNMFDERDENKNEYHRYVLFGLNRIRDNLVLIQLELNNY